MLLDKSYFIGPLALPQLGQPSVLAHLNTFIGGFEPEVLQAAMGYDLYSAFLEGLDVGSDEEVEQKWLDLRDGCIFITQLNIKKSFRGIANNTTKQSIIAPIVYTQILRDAAIVAAGVGTVKPESDNATTVDPTLRMTDTWYKLWVEVNIMWELLRKRADVYTEYSYNQINYGYFRPTNIF